MSASQRYENARPGCRVAVNFSPEHGDPWLDAGSRWLGRCSLTREACQQPVIAGVSPAELRRLTAAPRRFGWQANLRTPFEPAPGVSLAEIRKQLVMLCKGFKAFELPAMKLAIIDDCLALVPEQRPARLTLLADSLLFGLHSLASRPGHDEVQRYLSAGLTQQQNVLLCRWGSPFVLDEFRFCFFLTGSLGGVNSLAIKRLISAAQMHFSGLPPLAIESLSVFVETKPKGDFSCLESIGFGTREIAMSA